MTTTANGGEDLAKTLDKTGGCNTAAGGVGQVNDVAMGAAGADVSTASGKDGDPGECRQAGHPVDVVSGQVVDRSVDLALPGPIPLVLARAYSSAFHRERSPLGRGGWTHALDQWIDRVDGTLTLRGADGRNHALPEIEVGATVVLRGQRLSVTRKEVRYEVLDLATRQKRIFFPLERDGRCLLHAVEDPWGNRAELVYAQGRLVSTTTAGRELRFSYDEKSRLVRVEAWAEGAARQAIAYAYTERGELGRATDALGHAEHFAYDAVHRLVKSTLKNGVSFYYAYDDETGRCVHTWGDGGLHDVELTYDLQAGETVAAGDDVLVYTWKNGQLLKEATPDGEVSNEYTYDDDQLVLSRKNAAGETLTFEYDGRGNRVKIVDPAGNETKLVYRDDVRVRNIGPDGRVTSITPSPEGAPLEIVSPVGERFKLGYDGAGNLTYVHAGDGMLASFGYDERQNLVKETNARGASTVYTYDPMGRPLTQTDALGRVTRVEYDAIGRPLTIARRDGTTIKLAYDALGNVVRQTDPMGRVTRMEYAGTGVMVRQILPNGQTWSFAYDGAERLRKITNPKKEEYEFSYDRAGRVVEERTFDGRTLTYAYDKSSNLRRVDYPDETFRELSYDPLGNVLEEASSHGPVKYERDKLGRLLTASVVEHNGKTVVELTRDDFGRVTSEIQNGLPVTTTYDARGRKTSRELPGGEVTKYRYDRANAVVGLEHDGHAVSITRDELGRETRRQSAKVVELVSTYDTMDRLERRVAKSVEREGEAAQRVLCERAWSYDASGRVTGVADSRWGTSRYGYDEIGQLIEAQRGHVHEVFYYDGAGSLSAIVEGLTARAVPWALGEGNLLLQTEAGKLEYDARRRRVKEVSEGGKVTRYLWDCRDRLREVQLPDGSRALYTYDAFGRRARKDLVPAPATGDVVRTSPERVRTVSFLWDGDALAHEIDSERGKRVYVYAPGSLVPILQQEQKAIYTYVVDHLGAPRELIDGEGRVAWSAATSAWGTVTEVWREAGARTVETPFRLVGQYADEETGLAYARFRYFDPSHGRWISPDPIGVMGGPNLSGFAGAPTVYVDPLGLAPDPDPAFSNGWNLDPSKDLDWRGTGATTSDALTEAFARTGVPRDEFEITRWGYTELGKSVPVEWRSPGGAEVNMDMAHSQEGPGVPHVGYQSPGKRCKGGAVRGHILLDSVPANR